jgi:catechol 2,3-dioxygenase-like lactoylglutathione lyase family enzyme
MDLKLISSVVFVKDMQASRQFYETVLGQKVLMDHGPNVGFEGGFALWQVEHAHQMVFAGPKPMGSANFELYFETEHLDEMLARLDAHSIKLIHPLVEQPWGQRVIRCYDPDEHIVEIGEPMPAVILRFAGQGLLSAEIAKRTSMPEEIVKQILGLQG